LSRDNVENMDKKQSCIRKDADQIQINACKEVIQTNQESFSQLSNLLALAGNEVRLKILFLLHEEKELCPCDLSDILEMTIPAISQHLRKLKDRNVITRRRDGQTLYYSIKPEQLGLLEPLFEHINTRKNTLKTIF